MRLALDLYEAEGMTALKLTARGRSKGQGRLISAEKEERRYASGSSTSIRPSSGAPRSRAARFTGGDETALVNTDVRGRDYAPRGKTPVAMAVGGTRQKLSMIFLRIHAGTAVPEELRRNLLCKSTNITSMAVQAER